MEDETLTIDETAEVPETVNESPEPETVESLRAKLAEALAQIAAKTDKPIKTAKVKDGIPANQKPRTPKAGREYVLLTKEMSMIGKVPQQQADLAKLIASCFDVGSKIPESLLFATIEEKSVDYPSLANAKQDPTYVFTYYRGLSNKDQKHAGFIARGFLVHN